MQEGRGSTRQDAGGDFPHQESAIIVPAMLGMGAYAADLDKLCRLRAFAGHRYQAAFVADTDEMAWWVCTGARGAGLCHRYQRQHFLRLVDAHFHDVKAAWGSSDHAGHYLRAVGPLEQGLSGDGQGRCFSSSQISPSAARWARSRRAAADSSKAAANGPLAGSNRRTSPQVMARLL